MKTIGLVTVARSDYGICLPIIKKIQETNGLKLQLVVSGSHLSDDFGRTERWIEADHIPVTKRIPMPLKDDTAAASTHAIAAGIQGFGDWYAEAPPDILVLVGDRYEMHAAAVAAVPFRIPIAHIHGGEITEGAMDDALRHSLTKLSHLHFVTTLEYAKRLEQMGEESWRIRVTGAPALDQVNGSPYASKADLEKLTGLSLETAPILVTFHPVTLELDQTRSQIEKLIQALGTLTRPIIITAPNADMAYREILNRLDDFIRMHSNAKLVKNLGNAAYFGLMKIASAMVGNSSSGIIEAASFRLPVVNIGNRQKGRMRASNVIDCDVESASILQAIEHAISPAFRQSLSELKNPYGDGHAAERIVQRLVEVPLDKALITKRFIDHPFVSAAAVQ